MDQKEAGEALASADTVAARIRAGHGSHGLLLSLLGAAMAAMTAAYGLLGEAPSGYGLQAVLLVPFFALVIYTATRPVLPRRHRSWYAVTTACGAGVYSVTVAVGTAVFPGEPLWWGPGAALCAAPFLVVAALDRRAVHPPESRP
jgi:hypothetical protein